MALASFGTTPERRVSFDSLYRLIFQPRMAAQPPALPPARIHSSTSDSEPMVRVRTVFGGCASSWDLQHAFLKSLSPADSGVDECFPATTLNSRAQQLVAAVRDGDAGLAIKLLKLSAGCEEVIKDTIDHNRNTLLHIASASGDSRLVLALVSRGADVNARNSFGMTALHCAASYGISPAIVAILLRHGADPNVIDQDGDTPLTNAISLAHVAVVQQLLAAHADLSFSSPKVTADDEISHAWLTPRRAERPRCTMRARSATRRLSRCFWRTRRRSMLLILTGGRPGTLPVCTSSRRSSA